ncbi:MAG: FtsK/SpoIIIE domain-containing protein, partial [Acidimicrobiia bacterium]|nr:FtsK/SpoIIIE domain-containing protein [Acidimicrobiia bacterium]
MVDLVSDGPHGLIAGTTGSGKSELLRSLIVSLAAAVSPDHLNFALIDYKGGSAFDACARLPHVVGVVTDLDARLGRRALTCLEAELRYREARLREIEAPDLPEYLRKMPEAPLPRLVVVIDEFAALAAELPGFIPSLVDIAQRGRSLGVHLLLATQRPAGVIGENIRANTNLRVALRVHDAADSRDVLDDQGAAAIPRGRAGRGFVRLGPGELIPFQAALVSAGRRPG